MKPKQVDPLALPADASMAALTKSFPVSAGIQHREVINDYDIDKEGVGEWTEGILLKRIILDYSILKIRTFELTLEVKDTSKQTLIFLTL